MDDEVEDINKYKIKWDNLSEDMKEAIFSFDAGKVAFILLREFKDMSVDEACDTANVLIKLFSKQMKYSEEVH